jgi:CRISPR/Cas system-associated protein Cas5 (RAMP superfamily)
LGFQFFKSYPILLGLFILWELKRDLGRKRLIKTSYKNSRDKVTRVYKHSRDKSYKHSRNKSYKYLRDKSYKLIN